MAGSLDETRDIYLVSDLRPEMPEVSGVDALAQRLLLRLTTPKGIFPWWPDEGLDVTTYALSKEPDYRIAAAIKAECERDEQVDLARVEIDRSSGRLRFTVFAFSPLGDFKMTMGITQAAATLLALEAA